MTHRIQWKAVFYAIYFILLLSVFLMADPYYWGNNKTNCGTCHSPVVEKWSEMGYLSAPNGEFRASHAFEATFVRIFFPDAANDFEITLTVFSLPKGNLMQSQ